MTTGSVSDEVLRFIIPSVVWDCVYSFIWNVYLQVNRMPHFTDLARVEQVSSMVRRIEKDLEDCSERANLFNSRQQ